MRGGGSTTGAKPPVPDASERESSFVTNIVRTLADKFWTITPEERAGLLSDMVGKLTDATMELSREERRDVVRLLVDKSIDGLLANITPEERRDLSATAVIHIVRELQRNLTKWVTLGIDASVEGAKVLWGRLGTILKDPGFVDTVRQVVITSAKALVAVLVEAVRAVWGQIRETAPAVLDFIREMVTLGIKVLGDLILSFLRRLFTALAAMLGLAAQAVSGSKDLAATLWSSESAGELRGLLRGALSEKRSTVLTAVRSGAKSVDDLVGKTGLPAETVRRTLSDLWEAGEVGLDLVAGASKEPARGAPPGGAPSA